jgi:hypothetical protein
MTLLGTFAVVARRNLYLYLEENSMIPKLAESSIPSEPLGTRNLPVRHFMVTLEYN